MLKILKFGFLSMDLHSRIVSMLFPLIAVSNIYGFVNAYNLGSYDRAISHAIYTITLLALFLAILYSSSLLHRSIKFYGDAEKMCKKHFEEKRMEMYEKLLEDKDKEIQ